MLLTQAALALLCAAAFAAVRAAPDAIAALYGGGVALLISGWQAWRLRRVRGQPGAHGLIWLYAGAVQRYVAVFVLLGIGLGVLRLAPLPLVVAFAVAQLGYLVPPRD